MKTRSSVCEPCEHDYLKASQSKKCFGQKLQRQIKAYIYDKYIFP